MKWKTKILGFLRKNIESDFLIKEKNWQKSELYNTKDPEKLKFLEKNKVEVLILYKHMLKELPKMENNHFRRVCLKERIKFNFREGSLEDNLDMILTLKTNCYIIIEKVNAGIYPPFPHYKAF